MLVRRESEILLMLTTFRPEMKSLCGLIRIFAIKGAPTLSMTATATEQDVKEMRDCIGLKEEEIVVLRASPVQDHVKFQTVRRPPNGVGFDGDFSSSGSFRPGLGHLLNTIYLEQFISDIRKGRFFGSVFLCVKSNEGKIDKRCNFNVCSIQIMYISNIS